jgi:hypothetical protein
MLRQMKLAVGTFKAIDNIKYIETLQNVEVVKAGYWVF